MNRLDVPSDPVLRVKMYSALRLLEKLMPDLTGRMRAGFVGDQSTDFYEGMFRGLVTAAELLRDNPGSERANVGTLLMATAGIVVERICDGPPEGEDRTD